MHHSSTPNLDTLLQLLPIVLEAGDPLLIDPVLQDIHLLLPQCRPIYVYTSYLGGNGYRLVLYVKPGCTLELPKALKYHAYYIEEVLPNGKGNIRKNMFAARMGQILHATGSV